MVEARRDLGPIDRGDSRRLQGSCIPERVSVHPATSNLESSPRHRSMQNNTSNPALIVVTGEPGAGKTTLALPLSQALRCPRVSRDEIKEGLIRTAGPPCPSGDEIARRAYEAFFDTLNLLLDRG